MKKAMHKETKQIVSAWRLENDPIWIGKERESWIAPYCEIFNWDVLNSKGITEVEVCFVKEHERNGEQVRAHFRIENKEAIPNPENESIAHITAKEGIYEAVWNNEILIGGKRIRDLFNIEDINLEFRLSDSKNSKIADVIVLFKEPHELYGRGIIFEIQFSNQNEEITEERSFDRIIEGYSVVWLWKGMFDNTLKLKKQEVEVVPFVKALKVFKEKIEGQSSTKLNRLSLMLDYQFYKYKKDLEENMQEKEGQLTSLVKSLEKKQEEQLKIINEKIKLFSEGELKSLKEEIVTKNNELIRSMHTSKEILNKLDYDLIVDSITSKEINLIRTKLEEILNENIKSKVDNLIIPEVLSMIIPKIESSYGGLAVEVVSKCSSCGHTFPVRMMDFENGKAYCDPCFNDLENNWRKRWFNQERIRKIEEENAKLKKELGKNGLDKFS